MYIHSWCSEADLAQTLTTEMQQKLPQPPRR
jgi:hypothetical protein